jgi:hypothetical protein
MELVILLYWLYIALAIIVSPTITGGEPTTRMSLSDTPVPLE